MIKRICDTHNKFKEISKSWISFEKSTYVIKLNQKAWLKSYFGINAELKKSKKMTLKNIFSSS